MASNITFVHAFAVIGIFCAGSFHMISSSGKKNSTVWRNDGQSNNTVHLNDGSKARFIPLMKVETSSFTGHGHDVGFGFHCKDENGKLCDLAILLLDITNNNTFPGTCQKVWSANATSQVEENAATLELASDGNMLLKDAKGREVWRSNTTGQVLSHLDITTTGNVRLFNRAKEVVWQSFDHPTDTLLVGQRLKLTQQLLSANNIFILKIRRNELRAYVNGRRQVRYGYFAPPQVPEDIKVNGSLVSVKFQIGGLIFRYKTSTSHKEYLFQIPITTSQFFKVDQDGGLRVYGWEQNRGWKAILVFGWDECAFPLKCGKYGVCQGGQCTCPVASDGIQHFKPTNPRQPNLGCEPNAPSPSLSGTLSQSQLIHFIGLSYPTNFCNDETLISGVEDEEVCKQACSTNTTCKAVLYNAVKGTCFLISNILTLFGTSPEAISDKIFLKILKSVPKRKNKYLEVLLGTTLFSALLAAILGISSFFIIKKKRACKTSDRLLYIEGLSETPIRFSSGELRKATNNFSKAIGEGGFGVVFEGVLENGIMVAVKQLKKAGQGMEEFVAEMETLGTIHHINLVTLIGFCVDISRGLAYLHHECRQKIAHLDVKPQNILLDDNFNAKLSDFGTSKLINRNESEVVTRVRGTLGYLAPEWQNGNITVKADTYSFGIVILEVITNRKILDYSQNPEHLLTLLQTKVTENKLMDIVNQYCSDLALESDREAVLTVIQLGMWCLNISYSKRPPMSMVVKILESVVNPDPKCNLPFRSISPSSISNCLSSI